MLLCFIEYVVTSPDGIARHVQSVFALRPAESVVGLTVQANEQDYSSVKEKLSVVLPSFSVGEN